MSASAYKLLLYLCVWTSILQANGIQNLRYPTRLDKNWRFGKRQDLLAKSRLFMWKPAFAPVPQMYQNIKTPISPHNFNRYSMPAPPPMAAIHHQNYMYNNVPTKMNYPLAAYMQPVKDVDEKRKPGNLHHITIINAIMPKPYLPTSPTLNHHSHHNQQTTSTFRNYRTNNKLHYTPQYFNNNINNNFPRQNMENLNKLTQHQQQLTLPPQLQPQQIQPMQMVYTSSPLTFKVNTPTMEYMNIVNYNTKVGSNSNNDYEENEITNTITKCGRKTKDDTNNSGSDVLYYYCNNRITNYKNPAEQQQSVYTIPSSTTTSTTTTTPSTTTSSTTTTTTTEFPTTSTSTSRVRTTIKSLDNDYDYFTTEKTSIFLPTPNAPVENSFTPIASAFREQNSLNNLDITKENDFKSQRHTTRFTKYEDFRTQQQRQRQSNYNNIKRQHYYTTLAPTAQSEVYDGMKLHSFFTIEDAVTRIPEMQVFNDPYQAYRHARRHHSNKHLRQNYQTTISTTTTRESPTHTTFTARPKIKSFFDDLDEEEYIIPDNTAHYDYSVYNKPQKSSYYKANYNNENSYPQSNQILSHNYKTSVDNSYFNEGGDIYMGKPKIKEHHFDLFKAIASTSIPIVTTYKPYNNLRELFLTTPKIESSFTFNPKTLTFTTTKETVLGNDQGKTETENSIFNLKANDLGTTITTTFLPITTTTTRKSPRLSLKTPLNLRPTNTFKYTKPRGILKSHKNLTTTTTTTAMPTLKKVSKYQRRYKGKKLKQFKHLYTTTPSTTSSSSTTTTTEIPTTLESITKRQSFRVLPTTTMVRTTTTSTEEPITRKITNSRTTSTTDSTKIKKTRQQVTTSTEKSNRSKLKSIRTSTTPPTAVKNSTSSTRRPAHRRGTKRANIARNEAETKTTANTRKAGNKRRRLSVTSTSTTTKPYLTRSTSRTTTTTSTTTTTLSPPIRKSTTSTTTTSTTMKSIMRIANSKARTKNSNDFKSAIRSNDINDERLFSRALATSTAANINIPPLPIEIYFKKSQNAKI